MEAKCFGELEALRLQPLFVPGAVSGEATGGEVLHSRLQHFVEHRLVHGGRIHRLVGGRENEGWDLRAKRLK
jgi:hypothetical protein